MKSYIISLSDENESKSVDLKTKIKEFGINPIWFNGLNGKTIDMEQYKHHFNDFYLNFLTPSQIGIALSHLYVWKKIAESDDEMGIVFEDDVVFTNDFSEKFNHIINNLPQDFDLLYLGRIDNSNLFLFLLTFLTGLSKTNDIVIDNLLINPKSVLQSHAYILSKKGAKQLINLLDGYIYNHIDVCINNLFLQDKLKVYALKDRIVFQESLSGVSTNVSCNFPQILSFCSNIYVDEGVPLSYILNINLYKLLNFNINTIVLLSLIIGIIFSFLNINPLYILLLLMLIFIPDIKYVYDTRDIEYIKIFSLSIFLLITPTFIKSNIQKQKASA
jgi:GR25 family glycosyltransferase involved in LPS biosynthesis